MKYRDEDEIIDDDPELPDESDMDDDDQPDMIPCPYCRRFISEDAEQCHHCRTYLSKEDAPANRKSVFITIIVCALIIAAVVGWLLR